eukprot:scaffold19852_cov84-Isochrysis_galbana.AAC.2
MAHDTWPLAAMACREGAAAIAGRCLRAERTSAAQPVRNEAARRVRVFLFLSGRTSEPGRPALPIE